MLTANKPSLTALQNPGISPGQEVLFPDPEWPLHAFRCRQELEHTYTGGEVSKTTLKEALISVVPFLKKFWHLQFAPGHAEPRTAQRKAAG